VDVVAATNLVAALAPLVGRREELASVAEVLSRSRLVTLVGAGGCGKSRLAVEAGLRTSAQFDGSWFVDLAPLQDPDLVLDMVAATLGIREEPGVPMAETVARRVDGHSVLAILDNCEHVLDGAADAVGALLCTPGPTVLATSREPLGIGGEVVLRVPSLAMSDAFALFVDRAQQWRPGYEGEPSVEEICSRLDGMPLAIELAAARMRVLSAKQIADGLNDRFRLLTGGARRGVRRQQTLRASVDWSYSLLTALEQSLFRRVAVFAASFDLPAAEAVGAADPLESAQVLDPLTSLVDKSLVIAEEDDGVVRYRMLETIRQYATERLSETDEGDEVRRRHRDHFLSRALAQFGVDSLAVAAELENLRLAMRWSLASGEVLQALWLASLLAGHWFPDHPEEGRRWLHEALAVADDDLDPRTLAIAYSLSAMLDAYVLDPEAESRAARARELAASIGDDGVLGQALGASAWVRYNDPRAHRYDYAEALQFARRSVELRRSGPRAGLGFALVIEGLVSVQADPRRAAALADEARAICTEVQDAGRVGLGGALGVLAESALYLGDLDAAIEWSQALSAQLEVGGDDSLANYAKSIEAWARALRGDAATARTLASEALAHGLVVQSPSMVVLAHVAAAMAALADGDLGDARAEFAVAHQSGSQQDDGGPPAYVVTVGIAIEAALVAGDDTAARAALAAEMERSGAEVIRMRRAGTLCAAARVAAVDGDLDRALSLAHDGLALREQIGDKVGMIDALELLAAIDCHNGERAARLLGAAAGARRTIGYIPLAAFADRQAAVVAQARASVGDAAFDAARVEGEALPLDAAVAYARRGRGERRRPPIGWASLTPAEREVAALVAEGLDNPSIASRLFISPRTVNSHLGRIYRKLDVTSRVQLAGEVTRRRG
jgi:predicted ATPase/DNA-binding CsgD family transcriptional regulator